MKSLNHVQETLLIRVLLYLEILTSEVLMKMMKTVTEARSEPENINQSETSIYIDRHLNISTNQKPVCT